MKLICLLFTLVFTSLPAQGKSLPDYCPVPLAISFHDDWYPYIFGKDTSYAGTDYDFINTIANALGCEVSVAKMPEKRGHRDLAQGLSHVLLAATVTEQRAQYAYFSAPYRQEIMSVFYLKQIIPQPPATTVTLADVMDNSHFVVINEAAWYGENIEAYRHNDDDAGKFLHIPGMENRIQMLRKARAQAMIEDHMAGCSYFQRQAPDVIAKLAVLSVHHSDITFMFSKQLVTPRFMKLFNQEMAKQINEGVYDEIVAMYQAEQCS